MGLDVSKDNVTGCLLSEFPNVRDAYRRTKFWKFYATNQGLKDLILLKPDVAVLEPTGTNYSKLWVYRLTEAGIKVAMVNHDVLKGYRQTWNLPNKNDYADALALACYYLQFHADYSRFVSIREPHIAALRDTILRLQHLKRIQSPLINRLKQDLAWAFPERSKASIEARLFWRWVAGQAENKKYDKALESSCGLGLTPAIRMESALLVQTQTYEADLLQLLEQQLSIEAFTPYHAVFDQFVFGKKLRALLLSNIYPIDRYMEGGKAIVEVSRSITDHEKRTKKHLGLRRFTKTLGVAPRIEASGDSEKQVKAGSALLRKALWQWCFTRIEVKTKRPQTAVMRDLCQYFDAQKEVKHIRLARSRTIGRATKQLFKLLVAIS